MTLGDGDGGGGSLSQVAELGYLMLDEDPICAHNLYVIRRGGSRSLVLGGRWLT